MFSIFICPHIAHWLLSSLWFSLLLWIYAFSPVLISESAEERDHKYRSLINCFYLEVCFYFQYLGYHFCFQVEFLVPDVISGNLLCGFLRTHPLLILTVNLRY